MIAYVSFVAIANIFLGMLLARVIASREESRSAAEQRRESQSSRQEHNEPIHPADEIGRQSTAVQGITPGPKIDHRYGATKSLSC